jgi:hypothetical protein
VMWCDVLYINVTTSFSSSADLFSLYFFFFKLYTLRTISWKRNVSFSPSPSLSPSPSSYSSPSEFLLLSQVRSSFSNHSFNFLWRGLSHCVYVVILLCIFCFVLCDCLFLKIDYWMNFCFCRYWIRYRICWWWWGW